MMIFKDRNWWCRSDPEIVADSIFAVANWLSFSRLLFLMPAFEMLGPLQISLGRMASNIIRFLVIFSVVSIPSSPLIHLHVCYTRFEDKIWTDVHMYIKLTFKLTLSLHLRLHLHVPVHV